MSSIETTQRDLAFPCRKAGFSAGQCGDRTLPAGKPAKRPGRGQVVTQWMPPRPPTQSEVTENSHGMGSQLGTTDSPIAIPWTERRLVDARISGLVDSPGKLFTHLFRC